MGEDLLTYWLLIYEMNGFGLILQALKFMVQLEPLNLHRARVFFFFVVYGYIPSAQTMSSTEWRGGSVCDPCCITSS